MKKYLLALYLIALISCDDTKYSEDESKCGNTQSPTKESCTSVQLQLSENYCCLAYEESNKEDAECRLVEEKDYDTYSNSKSFAYEKEIIGFDCYNEKSLSKNDKCESSANENYKYIYECKDGKATVTNIYSFTDQEKQILQKDNHCLSYLYKLFGEQPYTPTKKDCNEAILTEQAKSEGITCGFYEFVYVLKNKNDGKENLTKKSCYLLNPNAINNESKAKKELKEFALKLVPDKDDEDFNTIQISMSDNSEHSFSYDSKAGTLIDNNKKNDNNSKLISFSKILFLLLLISL